MKCEVCGSTQNTMYDIVNPLCPEKKYCLCPDCMYSVYRSVEKWIDEGEE